MICRTDMKRIVSILEGMADVIRRHSKSTREINQARMAVQMAKKLKNKIKTEENG